MNLENSENLDINSANTVFPFANITKPVSASHRDSTSTLSSVGTEQDGTFHVVFLEINIKKMTVIRTLYYSLLFLSFDGMELFRSKHQVDPFQDSNVSKNYTGQRSEIQYYK